MMLLMKRLALLFLLAPLAHAFGEASIDLTPIPATFPLEGASGHCVKFQSTRPSKPVQYIPAWPLSGASDKATFKIPDLGASGGILRFETAQPLDLSNDDAVKEWITHAMPKGAENVQINQIVRNPVYINGQPTVEAQLSYTLFGLSTTQAKLLVRRPTADPTELLCFQVETVHPEQFEKLDRTLIRSLYSIIGF